MNFRLLWEHGVTFDRSVPRTSFRSAYWSANVLNFNSDQMPDALTDQLDGFLGIVEVDCDTHTACVPPEILGRWHPSGVMDAFYMGSNFPRVIREHKAVLAVGSLGPVGIGSESERGKFCPTLFVFGDAPYTSVSLGIERLKDDGHGQVLIPAKSKLLVWRT